MADPQLAIEAAVAEGALEGRSGVVLAWHLVAAYRLDGDGEGECTRYWQVGPPGQPSYVALGLMAEGAGHIGRTAEND